MRKETIESFIKDTEKKLKDGKIKRSGGITRLLNALRAYTLYSDHISYLDDLNELAFLQIRNLSAHSWYLFQQLRGNDPKPIKKNYRMEELLIKVNEHLKSRKLTYKFFVACDGTTFYLFYQNTFAPADGFEKMGELPVNTNPTESHLISWVDHIIDNPPA